MKDDEIHESIAIPLTWHQWLTELKREALRLQFPINPDADEAWRGYYDDEYSPLEAIREDASYHD
jgi:hypothetical protein